MNNSAPRPEQTKSSLSLPAGVKPYYHDERAGIAIFLCDFMEILPSLEPVDVVVVDPPYGETSLAWDQIVKGWADLIPLKASGSVWCFGSLRSHLKTAGEWANFTLAQDVIWEKHNGSSFFNDRFRRVHEQAVHFYRGTWKAIYKSPQFTNDAKGRVVRKKEKPAQWHGATGSTTYASEDGGPRLQRSVIQVRSCHGNALHPTQKPIGILAPLINYSCPPDGVVLDPFMGSGSTLVAAKEAHRPAVGIEIDIENCEIAVRRLAQEVLL